MKKTFFVSTPIYYVNDIPHIGHAYSTIAADILARYHRLQQEEVLFSTGTDEHGQKVQKAADARGLSPLEHVNELHQRFQELWKTLNISHDRFIRTTEAEHVSLVQKVLQSLFDKEEIYSATYTGWYCTSDEMFWTEKDIVNGNCPTCGKEVEEIEEKNYFFKMSAYQDRLIRHIEEHENFILPHSRRNEILSFLKKPLEDLCISRPHSRLSWGIPLPFDKKFVTYVWFDALLNYITVSGYGKNDGSFEKFWPASHHIIGKDILTTHAVYWSTILMAAQLPLPENIFAHGWWTVDGKKMSKSLQNGINPTLLSEIYGVDEVRYFLMREVPFGHDGNFSFNALTGRINTDLANDLGNVTNRILSMCQRYFSCKLPACCEEKTETDKELLNLAETTKEEVDKLYKELAFSRILTTIWQLISELNKYIVLNEPWALAKTGKTERLASVLHCALFSLHSVATLLLPFMPVKAMKIVDALTAKSGKINPYQDNADEATEPLEVTPLPPLFPRLDEDEAERRKEAYVSALASHSETGIMTETTNTEKETPPQEEELISIDQFFKTKLKLGTILEAEAVPKSRKLIKTVVDLGEEKPRTILAGISRHYEPEELTGKQVIVVANLKPVKLMGIESQGMILCGCEGDKLFVSGIQGTLPPGSEVR